MTNEEIAQAVLAAVDDDANFRQELVIAIEEKNRHWLSRLITQVARDLIVGTYEHVRSAVRWLIDVLS